MWGPRSRRGIAVLPVVGRLSGGSHLTIPTQHTGQVRNVAKRFGKAADWGMFRGNLVTWRARMARVTGIFLVLFLSFGAAASHAQQSQGCSTLNAIAPDFVIGTLIVNFDNQFVAGDVVSATVRSGPGNATDAHLTVDGGDVDSTALPGTLGYVVPSDGAYVLVFQGLNGSNINSTWNFSCVSLAAPVPSMSNYGLAMTAIVLAVIATRRRRARIVRG